jgi:PAS domain S-box-containing protein
MKEILRQFSSRYTAGLRRFLAHEQEATLQAAYELGRMAIARELGVLNMARVHQEALTAVLSPARTPEDRARTSSAAETFFLEALSPFEAAHRGFREANAKLLELNETLKKRNLDLAGVNQALEKEIVERKRAELAVRESEARLQAVLDNSPAIIFLKDVHGRYLHINRQFEHAFQMARDEVVGKTDPDLFPAAQAASFRANDRRVLRAGGPVEFEETARYHDGQHTSIVSKFPLRDAGGSIYAICGIATDITSRKQAEEALRESEERFRLMVSNVKDYAIFLLTPDGRVASWNAGAEQINGYRAKEIIGRHFSCFYLPQDVERGMPQRELRSALRNGRFEEEGWRIRKDGSPFWANSVLTPIRDESGRLRGFAKVVRDMTERKRAEQALLESQEHYRHLFNRDRAMQENLRNLSDRILHVQEEERTHLSRELHDEVGQALTAINVNLAMVKRNGASRRADLSRKIADTQNLVEQTMETVHRFARELRPAMLDDLGLVPALRSYTKRFAERTHLSVRFHGNPVAESLSREQKTVVFRVTQESLTNVAKHARASRVEVSLRRSGAGLRLTVKDNGRAFKVERPVPGQGTKHFGLMGMQERVRLINGQFTIASKPGHGTTVSVEIPFHAPSTGKTAGVPVLR